MSYCRGFFKLCTQAVAQWLAVIGWGEHVQLVLWVPVYLLSSSNVCHVKSVKFIFVDGHGYPSTLGSRDAVEIGFVCCINSHLVMGVELFLHFI